MTNGRKGPADVGRLCRCAGYDPREDGRITPEHYFILDRLGEDGIALDELHALGDAEIVAALVADLVAWGAVATDDASVAEQAEASTDGADDDVELEEFEQRRLLDIKQALDDGGLIDYLGIEQGTDRRALQQAYAALRKQFDPSYYAGRNLGSFAEILQEIHLRVSQALKALGDSRTTTSSRLGREFRRRSERLIFRGTIYACCVSWEKALKVLTEDLSDGGLFLVTEQSAKTGETVVMELETKAGPLQLVGTVAWTRPVSEAERGGREPGFGVRLSLMSPETRAHWQSVVDKVSHLQPTADPSMPEPGRIAQGTGRYRREPIIGIDFGTSYTSVCATVDNRVVLLPWANGEASIPSVVAFPAPGRHLVGSQAKSRLLTDPRHTIASAKRLLGRRMDDRDVQGHLGQVPYDTAVGPDGYVMTEMWGESYHMAQVCSYVFHAARETAEQALDRRVSKAVVAVPVSFTPERLQMMRRAAKLANLELVDVIEEPNAAALANRSAPDFGGLVGIYDFGGGTFDFSIVDASGGDFRVLATTGDSWLGGDDLDLSVAEAAAGLVWRQRQVDLRHRVVEWQQLLFACEQAKRELSTEENSEIFVPEYHLTADGPIDLRMKVSRGQAERLWAEAIERSLATCSQALHLLGLKPSDLSQIFLSGGSTYTPAVRGAVERRFGVPVRTVVPPDFAVCLGAGVHAATLERRQPLLRT